MKMELTFGIYEDEIEPVLAAVWSRRPLAEIEALPCPCCGARLTVSFAPAGNAFQVFCSGEPLHLSRFQAIAQPPTWWTERIADTSPITFYWRVHSGVADDGRLGMPVSGYNADGCHWNGAMTVSPDQPDYLLWRWIIAQGDRYKPLISDRDLESIREEYLRFETLKHR
jgi:hypothetical protein